MWLYGNSTSVDWYHDMIDSMEFLHDIPVFAALDVNITAADSQYVIDADDSGHIYGTVTIYAGGSIEFKGNVDLNCQQMIQSDLPGPPS